MSSHHTMSVEPPAAAPAVIAAVLGIPTFVVLAVAVILHWGR